MFKNALIISDNSFLVNEFFKIIERKKITYCNFSFAISPFSKKENFKIIGNRNFTVVDLKRQDDIDFIKNNYDLVFSIHCKQIFPVDLLTQVKCINIHPGYNPINRGWYPQVFAIINNLPVGATIHEIDEKLDNGGIIAREYVSKNNFDTSETLYNKIIHKEIELLDRYIVCIVNNNYNTNFPEGHGNLFLKKDFNELLELDLKEQISVGQLIDRLRALSHGDYKNAYFIDPATGKKIFIGIRLHPEDNE